MHLFAYHTTGISGNNLCDYTASQVKELYRMVPCKLEVAKAFGLQGLPVIVELFITKKDFCTIDAANNNPSLFSLNGKQADCPVPVKAMITGTVVIRVVPYNP